MLESVLVSTSYGYCCVCGKVSYALIANSHTAPKQLIQDTGGGADRGGRASGARESACYVGGSLRLVIRLCGSLTDAPPKAANKHRRQTASGSSMQTH